MNLEITSVEFWRQLHSYWIDALEIQLPENLGAIVTLTEGIGFGSFVHALAGNRLRAVPAIGDDGCACIGLEILADEHWLGMVRIPARLLHLEDEVVRQALDDELDAVLSAILGGAQ